MSQRKRIAVVGAGVAGLGAAWALRGVHDVTLFEKDHRLGGHANTVDVDYDGTSIAVDTGFIVFNDRNYPNINPFFQALGVESFRTDMSFGFSTPGGLEWSSNASGLFAQKRNLANPTFLKMLGEVLRFNTRAPVALADGRLEGLSLGLWLDREGFSETFRRAYLLPMGAAIWSSTESEIGDFPAASFVKFFDNHRLMHRTRPAWRTVIGGSRSYVRAAWAACEPSVARGPAVVAARRVTSSGSADGIEITDAAGETQRFDEAIFACHADQALAILKDADPEERAFLGAVRFSKNVAVLHRDTSLLPRRRKAWASWNYRIAPGSDRAAVTYDMNRLQGIDAAKPVFVTLNPVVEPPPDLTFARFQYDHPQFDAAAVAAQRRFNRIQGVNRAWFAGAWLGYGFHEDGLRAGLRAALKLGGTIPWDFVEGDVDGGAWGEPGVRAHALEAAS